MKIRKIFCLILSICLLWNTQLDIKAATASQVRAYGFNVASEGYKYTTYFNNPTVMNVYTSNGVNIGTCVIYVARARATTLDSSGYYYDTLLIRSDMEPIVTKSNGTYYRG